MSDKKHTHEANKTFRSSDKKAPLTEHEEKQRALLKNLERLKAERLAREAAKSKDNRSSSWRQSGSSVSMAGTGILARGGRQRKSCGLNETVIFLAEDVRSKNRCRKDLC
jgi:hypothetical protein